MEIQVGEISGVQVVQVTGSVDAGTAERFEQGLLPVAQKEAANVVVDLGRVSYMSSAGLRILLAAQKVARAQGGEVVLAAMPPNVQEVFTMVGFDALFRSFPSLELALRALGAA